MEYINACCCRAVSTCCQFPILVWPHSFWILGHFTRRNCRTTCTRTLCVCVCALGLLWVSVIAHRSVTLVQLFQVCFYRQTAQTAMSEWPITIVHYDPAASLKQYCYKLALHSAWVTVCCTAVQLWLSFLATFWIRGNLLRQQACASLRIMSCHHQEVSWCVLCVV
jgi:hypothetical protein